MNLKNIATGINLLQIILFVGFFIGHGFPKSLILWSSGILWLLAPLMNLLYIWKKPQHFDVNSD